MWIIENNFAMDWDFVPGSFFKCTDNLDKDQKEMMDRYAIKEVGTDPARYGYVKMEYDGAVDSGETRIVFKCDSKEILEFVYDRVADAIIHHPDVIDLRGKFNNIEVL
jgi:hypothetical protein